MAHKTNEPLDAAYTHLEYVAQNLDHFVVRRLRLHLVDRVNQANLTDDDSDNERAERHRPECASLYELRCVREALR